MKLKPGLGAFYAILARQRIRLILQVPEPVWGQLIQALIAMSRFLK